MRAATPERDLSISLCGRAPASPAYPPGRWLLQSVEVDRQCAPPYRGSRSSSTATRRHRTRSRVSPINHRRIIARDQIHTVKRAGWATTQNRHQRPVGHWWRLMRFVERSSSLLTPSGPQPSGSAAMQHRPLPGPSRATGSSRARGRPARSPSTSVPNGLLSTS